METRSKNDNKERLRELAAQIATEQDHDKFMKLVEVLNQLLDEKLPQPHNSVSGTDA